jgi:orotidine-5'-phosphate decarboxylase
VSVLTSWTEDQWRKWGKSVFNGENSIQSSVQEMIQIGKIAGIAGSVSSAHELNQIIRIYPECFTVVPGIRPRGIEAGDQARTVTPREAKQMGASAIVVGRPITLALNPRQMCEQILEELRGE